MNTNAEIFFPPFRLDVANEQLWCEERLIPLRPKTFAILRYLAGNAGRLVTKDEILRAVWGETLVSDEGLRDYIREIRQALRDDAEAPRFVETVRGRGYRFLPAITTQPVVSRQFSGVSSDEGKMQNLQLATGNWQPQTKLVGRNADLVELHERLEKALRGERQLMFVTGEPGIGKTSLIEAFLAAVGAHGDAPGVEEGEWFTHGQCVEQHGAGEAFLPILDALGRLCRGPGGVQLIELLRRHAPMWLVQLPAFIEPEELETLQRKVQGASRERMLRELTEAIEVLTNVGAHGRAPLLLVLEDLHWSDVSTLDFLAFLARRKEAARLMIVGTYRPVEMLHEGHPLKSMTQESYGHGLAVELALGALREADIERYLENRFGVGAHGRAPLQGLARTLHQRTGGNPLFLVSLVNDLVGRDALVQTEDGWTLQREIDPDGIPESIRHLVARQSGRLSHEEQQTLEAASVAGMEFSAAAVAAALESETAVVEQRCERLAERQQFLRRMGVEQWPDGTLAARYTFLHALYQQLWHERVTPTQLQYYHFQIGQRKEQAYGERAREIAAELAIHFEQGREYRKAVQHHGTAGQQALHRSAPQEAIGHLTTGITLLHTLPDSPERQQQELVLQMSLGVALIAIKGYAAPEVEAAYARAHALCQRVGDAPQLFPVLFGLLVFYQARGKLKTALELATQLQHLARRRQNSIPLVEAHFALGTLLFLQGKFTAAHTSCAHCLSLYEPQQVPTHLLLYGHDPSVLADLLSAFVCWLCGHPNQAVRQAQAALTSVQALSHPYSQGFALFWAAYLHQGRRDVQAVQAHTEALMSLTRKQGFAGGLAHGMIMQGWALAEQEQVEEGVAQIRGGLAMLRAVGTESGLSYFLALLAGAHRKGGQIEEGLNVLAEALAQAERTEERFYEAELYRIKGELTLQLKVESYKSQVEEAQACFLKAIDIARRQQAKMWELRATASLARLWQQQGKKIEARLMLAEIYGWFTEGFETVDLKEARALLEELNY